MSDGNVDAQWQVKPRRVYAVVDGQTLRIRDKNGDKICERVSRICSGRRREAPLWGGGISSARAMVF
jgi:hypothetical protein